MTDQKQKPELHQSHITSYLLCGEAYRRRYIEQEIRPANYNMLRGTVTHTGREHNLRQKIESGKDCQLSDAVDATRDDVVEHFKADDINLDTDDLKGIKKQHVRDQMIDESAALVKADYHVFQRSIQPVAVELNLKISLPDYPFDLGGVIDTVQVGDIIRDLKTKSKTPNQKEVDGSMQLSLYSMFYEAWSGKKAKKLTLDCLVMLKGGIKPVELKTARTTEDQRACMNIFSAAYDGMQKGVFLPCDPNFWKCSPAYCEYYNDCRYVNSGK